MNLKDRRVNILKDIIELYRDTDIYGKLLELINSNENIVYILKSEAMVYSLLMTSNSLKWNGNHAIYEYEDYMVRYQKGYQLYIDFAYYFLGAIVVYPSLDYQVDSKLIDYAVNFDDFDYKEFLTDDLVVLGRKIA